jgi:hypothetical protein
MLEVWPMGGDGASDGSETVRFPVGATSVAMLLREAQKQGHRD